MEQEEWRDVVGWEGFYQVSNQGHIWSVRRNRIMHPYYFNKKLHPYEYPMISLTKDNKCTVKRVHILVARAFLGEPANGFEVNHKDCDKNNAALSNLEYVTKSENTRHAIKMGMRPSKPPSYPNELRPRGEQSGRAKLTNEKVIEIRRLKQKGFSCRKIARQFQVDPVTISHISTGKTWRHLSK